MNSLKTFSNLLKVSFFGVGRDNKMCIILDISKLLTIVILPNGVIFLPPHSRINLSI